MSAPVQVRTTVGDDWADYRELRLEMLADSPDAFTDTLERARRRTERGWRRRLGRNSKRAVTVAAIESEQWIGSASAHLRGGVAMLVAVYVALTRREATNAPDEQCRSLATVVRSKSSCANASLRAEWYRESAVQVNNSQSSSSSIFGRALIAWITSSFPLSSSRFSTHRAQDAACVTSSDSIPCFRAVG
jgi:hypothetical protein